MPPLPSRWRRRMLALGSGDPTKSICSTLIAQAFQSVGYPILPDMRRRHSDPGAEEHNREILTIRHYSLYTPRDFDISPYFEVVKPTIEHGFTYASAARHRTEALNASSPQATTAKMQPHCRLHRPASAPSADGPICYSITPCIPLNAIVPRRPLEPSSKSISSRLLCPSCLHGSKR